MLYFRSYTSIFVQKVIFMPRVQAVHIKAIFMNPNEESELKNLGKHESLEI